MNAGVASGTPRAPVPRVVASQGPVWLVLIYLCLLFLLPSKYSVAGPVGFTPAGLFGLGMFAVWLVLRMNGLMAARSTAVHVAAAGLGVTTIGSYVIAASRPTLPTEMAAADRAIVLAISYAGVLLLTADSVTDHAAMKRVLRWLGALYLPVTLLALAQNFLGHDPLAGLNIPGLVVKVDWLTDVRGGLIRVSGTALHAIEYGVTVAAGLPFLIHQAIYGKKVVFWRFLVALATTTLFLALTRSAVICLVVILLTLLPTWPRSRRRFVYISIPVGAVLLRLIFPGLVGTVVGMFTWFSEDTSTQARSADYESIAGYVARSPLLGLGEGTYLPSIYRTLDNQYLVTLLSQGLLGLVALLAVFGSAVWLAASTRLRTTDEEARSLLQSLLASVLAVGISFAFYDGLSFPQASGLLFVMLGLVAAASRVYAPAREAAPLAPARISGRRRVAVALAGGILAVASTVAFAVPSGTFATTWTFHIRPDQSSTSRYWPLPNIDTVVNLVAAQLISDQGKAEVVADGGTPNYTVAQGTGSLAVEPEASGGGPVLRIRATGRDPAEVERTMEAVRRVTQRTLSNVQLFVDAPAGTDILIDAVSTPAPGPALGHRSRAIVGLGLLFGLASLFVWLLLPRILGFARRRPVEPEDPAIATAS